MQAQHVRALERLFEGSAVTGGRNVAPRGDQRLHAESRTGARDGTTQLSVTDDAQRLARQLADGEIEQAESSARAPRARTQRGTIGMQVLRECKDERIDVL